MKWFAAAASSIEFKEFKSRSNWLWLIAPLSSISLSLLFLYSPSIKTNPSMFYFLFIQSLQTAFPSCIKFLFQREMYLFFFQLLKATTTRRRQSNQGDKGMINEFVELLLLRQMGGEPPITHNNEWRKASQSIPFAMKFPFLPSFSCLWKRKV